MLENAGGQTMTTMKLKILFESKQLLLLTLGGVPYQFAVVEMAFAGARIANGVISAGYSQVMPSQPMAKNELKTNRKTAATIPLVVPPFEVVPAKTAIDAA